MRILELPGARTVGKPKDWDDDLDGGCGSIFVLDAVDLQSGLNQMFTFYRFSDEELEELKAGGVLRLGIMSPAHPVFNMGVLSKEIGNACGAEERWEIGSIIRPEEK